LNYEGEFNIQEERGVCVKAWV